jgi:hypothetical protein
MRAVVAAAATAAQRKKLLQFAAELIPHDFHIHKNSVA